MGRENLVYLMAVAVLVASALARTCPTIEVSAPQLLEPSDGRSKHKLFFGKYFRISGDWLLVGAYGTKGFRGKAHFFQNIGGSWTFTQSVDDAAADGGDYFGLYLAISGTVAAVSSPYHSTYGRNKIGKVIVYEHDGSTWLEHQTLQPDAAIINNGFSYGYGVGMQGDTIVVGARGADKINDDLTVQRRTGAIFIYTRTGPGAYFELGQVIYGSLTGTQFGDDILVGGLLPDTGVPKIVATAPRNAPSKAGAAYVFLQDSDSQWYEHQILQPDDSMLSRAKTYTPHFWEGAAFWKDTLIGGGERAASDAGRKTGAAWVWDLNQSSQWVQGDGLFPEHTGRFGQRLDVHGLGDGSLVAFVGSWYEEEAGAAKAGAAYYFVQCDDGTWSRGPRMALPNPVANDQFGNMVAMGDGVVAIGAPKRDTGSREDKLDRGAVYVYNFRLVATTTPSPEASPTPTSAASPTPSASAPPAPF